MARLLLIVLFCFSGAGSYAQTPPYFTIGSEEFSNVDVYSLLYDDPTDLLYAATNRGLFVYRQNRFTVLRAHPKQRGVSFFQLRKDSKGSVFCCNPAGQVFLIKEGHLELFYQLPKLLTGHSFRYFFDQQNNLIVSTAATIRKIIPSGAENTIFDENQGLKHSYKSLSFDGIRKVTQLANGDIYFSPRDNSCYLKYNGEELSFHTLSDQDGFLASYFFELDQKICYALDGEIKSLSDSNFSVPIRVGPASSFNQFGPNNISILSEAKGLRILELENDSIKEKPFGFEDYFLSSFAHNENLTIFLGTFKEGIVVIPHSQVDRYSSEYPFTGITVSKRNQVYLSNQKKELFIHDNGPVKKHQYVFNIDNLFYLEGTYGVSDYQMQGLIYELAKEGGKYWSWADNIKDLKEFDEEIVAYICAGTAGIFLKDHSIKLHPEFGIEGFPGHYVIGLEGRGRSITYIKNDSKIYYATNANVSSKNWNTGTSSTILYNGKSIRANYLAQLKGLLLIGTEKNGILLYENEVFKAQLSIKNGLKSNTILKVKVHKNLIIICSVKGIQIYDQSTRRFVNLGEAEGVLASKVIDFAISENELWLLEKHGYYSTPLDKLSSEKTRTELGRIELDSVLANDRRTPISSQAEFEYDQNNFQFFFDYRDIETKNETAFLYKLMGAQEYWKRLESSVNTLEFPSLAPGTYTLLLKAKYRGKETETVEYKFTILAPFWLRGWFFVMCGLVVISLVSLFFSRRVRKNRKQRVIELEKQKMQTDIFESKLKAIRSQMNPHFIFNSLNSIQALVLEQDAKKSYDYIEKIATLVRKTLQFSEKNFVQLTEEVEFLTIYADLESLRMKREFQFSIVNNIEDEIQIPALLIQPFIENAIHHGLLHKVGEKRLRIEFNIEDGSASCTVSDNGIGRQLSKEIKSRQNSHESFSLNAIKERLHILSEQNDVDFKYHIKDLYDEDGTPQGTEVKVYYPHLNNY